MCGLEAETKCSGFSRFSMVGLHTDFLDIFSLLTSIDAEAAAVIVVVASSEDKSFSALQAQAEAIVSYVRKRGNPSLLSFLAAPLQSKEWCIDTMKCAFLRNPPKLSEIQAVVRAIWHQNAAWYVF